MDQYDARRYLNEFLNLDPNYITTTPGKILLLSKFDNAFIGELIKTTPLDIYEHTISMTLVRPGFGRVQYMISHKQLDHIYFQVI
jgi:hypothetical protein